MKPKLFYGLLSAIIIIPFFIALYAMAMNSNESRFMIFLITMGFLSGIPAIILSVIHVVQIDMQKKKEKMKNNSKTVSDIVSIKEKDIPKKSHETETVGDKNLLDLIQKRLAKGEISVKEFQELKKEIST